MVSPGHVLRGFVVFALTFAARIKVMGDRHRHITYPDLIEKRYDTRTRIISTATTIIAYVGYTASQLLSAAHIITTITGIRLGYAFCIATTVTIGYTAVGGFFAVEKTDRFQALLIILGVVFVAVPLTAGQVGDVSAPGDQPAVLLLRGRFLGLGRDIRHVREHRADLLHLHGQLHQMLRGAQRQKRAQRHPPGRPPPSCASRPRSVSSGMSAKVLFPGKACGTSALITLIMNVFPAGAKGLMLVAILSAIMSTADACIPERLGQPDPRHLPTLRQPPGIAAQDYAAEHAQPHWPSGSRGRWSAGSPRASSPCWCSPSHINSAGLFPAHAGRILLEMGNGQGSILEHGRLPRRGSWAGR